MIIRTLAEQTQGYTVKNSSAVDLVAAVVRAVRQLKKHVLSNSDYQDDMAKRRRLWKRWHEFRTRNQPSSSAAKADVMNPDRLQQEQHNRRTGYQRQKRSAKAKERTSPSAHEEEEEEKHVAERDGAEERQRRSEVAADDGDDGGDESAHAPSILRSISAAPSAVNGIGSALPSVEDIDKAMREIRLKDTYFSCGQFYPRHPWTGYEIPAFDADKRADKDLLCTKVRYFHFPCSRCVLNVTFFMCLCSSIAISYKVSC